MKHFSLISAFILITLAAFSQFDTVYFDDYKDSRPSWFIDTEENTAKVETGSYVWQRKKDGEWSTWWPVNGLNPEEFVIETRFRITGNGSFGLLWGLKDLENTCALVVSSSGLASSYIESRNNRTVVRENIPVKNYKTDFNTLTISKKDTRVTFLVNGEKIHEEYFIGFFDDKV